MCTEGSLYSAINGSRGVMLALEQRKKRYHGNVNAIHFYVPNNLGAEAPGEPIAVTIPAALSSSNTRGVWGEAPQRNRRLASSLIRGEFPPPSQNAVRIFAESPHFASARRVQYLLP